MEARAKSERVRSLTVGLLLLGACHAKDEHEADGIVDPCRWASGWVGTPATSGTLGFEGPVERFAALGTGQRRAIVTHAASLTLPLKPDAVTAETLGGRTIACDVSATSYDCHADQGLRALMAQLGPHEVRTDQLYSEEGSCQLRADPQSSVWDAFNLAFMDLPCVAPEAVVVEGDLHGFDASQPLAVWLVGVQLPRHTDGFAGEVPYRACEVSGNHYVCTSLGYRSEVEHRVAVDQGTQRQVQAVSLPVEDCSVAAVQLDFERAP